MAYNQLNIGIDAAARRVLAAAYCYYVLDVNVMTDAEYDMLSEMLADSWEFLHPDHSWAFGAPESLRATGCHFRFSMAAAGGAYGWAEQVSGRMPDIPKPENWRIREDGVRYVTAVDARASVFHELVPARPKRKAPKPPPALVLDDEDMDLIGGPPLDQADLDLIG